MKHHIYTIVRVVYKLFNGLLNIFGIGVYFNLQYTQRLETNRPDYIRSGSLELFAREIYNRGVDGDVAELGVYRGDFAKDINHFFPDKTFYLFDTFEGFSDKDKALEIQNQYSTASQDFSDTNVHVVLSKMENKDLCVIRKGYFPDTAQGIDQLFCFVSIDADLYQPIFDALEFFYPLLASGGYIMVHDYNNDKYLGAKKAVRDFSSKYKIGFVSLPDRCGSAIFVK